jgi:hypothetical protein
METDMANPLLGNFTAAQHADACAQYDGRTDYEWKSECGTLALLRTRGGGLVVCCMGFYDPWLGTLEEAIKMLEATGEGED